MAESRPLISGAAHPTLLCSTRTERLYVANGTENAIAVIEFEPRNLVRPAYWDVCPSAGSRAPSCLYATHDQLCVANIKGLGSLQNGGEMAARVSILTTTTARCRYASFRHRGPTGSTFRACGSQPSLRLIVRSRLPAHPDAAAKLFPSGSGNRA